MIEKRHSSSRIRRLDCSTPSDIEKKSFASHIFPWFNELLIVKQLFSLAAPRNAHVRTATNVSVWCKSKTYSNLLSAIPRSRVVPPS